MKKFLVLSLSIVLCVCTLCVVISAASTGPIGDNVSFRVETDGDDTVLYIEGSGGTYSYDNDGESPLAEHASVVTKVVIDEDITKIGNYMFAGFTALKEVTIPAECSVGNYAFKDCTALETLNLSNNSNKIGSHAFIGCTALKEVKVVDDATYSNTYKIESHAFYGCISLEKVTLPGSITTLENHAFAYCSALEEIEITSTVKKIKDYAFKNCTVLKSITLPESVKEIGAYAFANCYALESFDFPSQVTDVSDRLLENCTSLASVTLAANTTTIGEYAFNGCTALETLSIPNTITSIGEYAFKNCSVLNDISIPDGVTWVQNGTFLGCSSLTDVTLPDSVKYIGQNAFSGCSSLESIDLPVNLVGINKNAFYECSSLSDIIIPKSVQYIKGYAFADSGVESLVVLSANTAVGEYAFGLYLDYDSEGVVSGATVYAPDMSLAKYYATDNSISYDTLDSYDGQIANKYTSAANEAAPSQLLAYRNGDASVPAIVIAGNPITNYEIVHQILQISNHKYITESAKKIESAFADDLGITLDRLSYADIDLNNGKNKIYVSLSLSIDGDTTSKGNDYEYHGLPINGTTCDEYILETYGLTLKSGEFVIFEYNGDIYIHAAGYQGLHYATAEFLESYLGFRFYIGNDFDTGKTVIESENPIEIPKGLFDYQSVIITDRDAQTDGYTGGSRDDVVIAAYRKLSSWKNRGAFVKDERYGGGVGYIGNAHTMTSILNTWYGASWWWYTPEVWNGEGWNPCLTDAGVLDKMINSVNAELDDIDYASYHDGSVTHQAISVSQDDTPNWCTCEACSAIAAKEGQSGLVINFVNEVADAVLASRFSDTKIWTLAYSNARYAPTTIVPRDNVIVCYTWQGCNNHPLTSDICTETTYGSSNIYDRAEFEKWNSITENMYVWLYPVNYAYYMAPSHEIYNLLEDVRYLADHNVYGVYFEGNYGDSEYGDGYSLEAVQAYMQSKVLWDPYMSETEYIRSIKEFIEFYYGQGYEEIYEFSKLDEEVKDATGCYVNNWEWPFDTYSFEAMAENFEDMMDLLDAAREKATTDAQRTNIDKLTAHVLFLGLSATNESDYVNGTEAQQALYKERYDRLVTILSDNGMTIGYNNQNVPTSVSEIDYSEMPYEWYGLPRLHRSQYDIRKYTEAIEAYKDIDILNSSYKEEIEAIIDSLHLMLKNDYPTPEQCDEIYALIDDAESMINEINEIVFEIGHITNDVNSYTEITVDIGDKDNIVQLMADIDTLINSGRLTEQEKENLENLKLRAKELIDLIEEREAIISSGNPFVDVKAEDWYYEKVMYVYAKGIMIGTSETEFSPNTAATRAMIVTMLWRLEGMPISDTDIVFDDVSENQYYTEAINWAAVNGIVLGYGDGNFGPNDQITREQMVTIIYRYSNYKGFDTSVGNSTNVFGYADAASISEYAIPAMQWACGCGLIEGDGTNLNPTAQAKRSEVATVIYRFYQIIESV